MPKVKTGIVMMNLGGPATLDQVEDVETEGMLAVVKALRKFNDFVVLDMWHAIEEATLGLMGPRYKAGSDDEPGTPRATCPVSPGIGGTGY